LGPWIAVRQCEVDGKGKIHLAAAEDILEEGVLALDLQVLEPECSLLLLHGVLSRAFLQLGESQSID